MKQLILGSLTLISLFAGPALQASEDSQVVQSEAPMVNDTYGNWLFRHDPNYAIWSAATLSEKTQGKSSLAISFIAEWGCEDALVEFSQPTPPPQERVEDGPYPGEIKLRVDKEQPWVLAPGDAFAETGLSADGTASLHSYNFSVGPDFTRELSSGSKVRILLTLEDKVDRFDLEGAKLAIGLARLGCVEYVRENPPTNAPEPDADLGKGAMAPNDVGGQVSLQDVSLTVDQVSASSTYTSTTRRNRLAL